MVKSFFNYTKVVYFVLEYTLLKYAHLKRILKLLIWQDCLMYQEKWVSAEIPDVVYYLLTLVTPQRLVSVTYPK